MAIFAYKATDRTAALIRGTIVADSPRQARDLLRSQGLDIQQVDRQVERAGRPRALRGITGRYAARVVSLIRELSTLLAVGIPLLEAMDTAIRSERHQGFKTALMLLRDRVASGSSLAQAMRQQPDLFDELAIHIVEVGENAGTLEYALTNIADFKEKAQQLRGRVETALMYPAIVLGIGLCVCLFLMTFIVPTLLESLIEAGRPLPTVTVAVKFVSDAILSYWPVMLILSVLSVASFRLFLSTDGGRFAWDRFLLRVPILGDLICKQAVVRIAMVIATLMRSGVPFVRAAQIAGRATRNRVLRQALMDVETAVMAGRDIGMALEQTDAFPSTVVQVFAVGQKSGRLEEMLERLSIDYDKQVNAAAGRLATAVEPILILAMAIMVLIIAFATLMPILEAGDVL